MAIKSVQKERWGDKDTYLLSSLLRFIARSDEELPPYTADTRKRDEYLQRLWRSESLLSGVVSSAVSRDKNRGWTLTGVARQVAHFSKRFHTFQNGIGWRQFVSLNSTAWYTTNFGYISEIGFNKGKNGSAETMWNMDSTRCRLTSSPEIPVFYYPVKGGNKKSLERSEFIHANSMPSFEEKFNYAGFCALERCLLFTRLMIGIFQHDLEKLGVSPPKGFLHGSGFLRSEWQQAVSQYKQDKLNKDSEVYQGVMGIFTRDPNAKLNLIGLSELPDNFTLKGFVDVLMQGYALAFGYPVGEFWSIETGSFGRTGEMNIQQEQANAKGEMDFALSFQEQLQTYFLPPSLSFSFDQRNDKGEHLKSQIDSEKVDTILNMVKASVLTVKEAKDMLVMINVIPSKFLASDEEQDEEVTDLQEQREKVLGNLEVRKFARKHLQEPIIEYNWTPILQDNRTTLGIINHDYLEQYDWLPGEIKVLFRSGEDMLAKKIF